MKGHTKVNTFPRWLKYKKHYLFPESLSTGRDFFCKKVKTKNEDKKKGQDRNPARFKSNIL